MCISTNSTVMLCRGQHKISWERQTTAMSVVSSLERKRHCCTLPFKMRILLNQDWNTTLNPTTHLPCPGTLVSSWTYILYTLLLLSLHISLCLKNQIHHSCVPAHVSCPRHGHFEILCTRSWFYKCFVVSAWQTIKPPLYQANLNPGP
jgi:hypothetical protein